jgi:polar amino acid transport system substrate-binding protein
MMKGLITLLFIVVFLHFTAVSAEPDLYRCGIAVGFPPYQYADANNQPAGIDYDITTLVFKEAGLNIVFVQSDWDDVLFSLAHRTGKVDLICGAEISAARRQLFDFSDTYYTRHAVLFTLKKSSIEKISDLYGKVVAGDRHSFFERSLGENINLIRIKTTSSKEESFQQLQAGIVEGVIAPKEVGYFISRRKGIAVKVLEETDPGSPVAFAVAKGNTVLLNKINESLRKLVKRGRIEQILRKYRQ